MDLEKLLKDSHLLRDEHWRQVHTEQQESGDSVYDVILRLGFLTDEQITELVSQSTGVECRHIPEKIAPNVINTVPAEFALRHCVLPLERNNGSLTVATINPNDLTVFEDLRMLTGCEIEVVLSHRSELMENIERYFGSTIEKMIANMSSNEEESDELHIGDDIGDLRQLASEPTVVNLVNLIIFRAVEENASDIHIEPFQNNLIVRYRIDGLLREMPPPPKHLQAAIVSRIKIMSEMDIAERYTPQDGHIRLRMENRELDFRVSTIPTVYGESAVLRILDKTNVMIDIADLGFFPDIKEQFTTLLRRSHGIILVTGPTGSGKTTTLYAALNRIKHPEVKIITVEDPVEYNIDGINQMQVNPKRGLTFANGLRAIVRQDPDIIMVGEIRDFETAEIAIRSALTGHLVFSTLHTNNASGAVTRLLDMGVDPFLISSSVSGVLAQRLVRRICKHCAKPYEPDQELLRLANVQFPPGFVPMKGKGCEICHNQGYKGRSGIFELLVLNDPLRELILNRPAASQIHQLAQIESLREYGWKKVLDHETTIEEIVRVTQEDEIAEIGN